MKNIKHAIAMMLTLILMSGLINAQTSKPKLTAAPQSNVQVAGAATTVTGSGTPGQLPKWLGSTPSTSVLGDSTITEDKFGKVGIGTTAPSSKLTVQGMVETTLGGVKFPDGTVQTTAAINGLSKVLHNMTLFGDGTAASPLGIAVPLALSGAPSGNIPVLKVDHTGGGMGISIDAFHGILINSAGFGIQAYSNSVAINAYSPSSNVMQVFTDTGVGVVASTSSNKQGRAFDGFGGEFGIHVGSDTGIGISAYSNSGLAGKFSGDVTMDGNLDVTGAISKGSGSFKIDHPLDPENKYLYHSFVESPDMKNIYDGVATLDPNGEAVVRLPEWFESLNDSYRYLLTAIGAPAPSLYIAEKVSHNQFKIAGGAPGMEVSWQVTGIRQDAYAKANRIKVEVAKPERERGFYLHPKAFGQPEEKSIEWARNPEMMRQQKEAKAAAQPNRVNQ